MLSSPSVSPLPGSFNGGLSSLPAHELGAAAIREVLRRAGLAPEEVSEVILGQVLTAGTARRRDRSARASIPSGLSRGNGQVSPSRAVCLATGNTVP